MHLIATNTRIKRPHFEMLCSHHTLCTSAYILGSRYATHEILALFYVFSLLASSNHKPAQNNACIKFHVVIARNEGYSRRKARFFESVVIFRLHKFHELLTGVAFSAGLSPEAGSPSATILSDIFWRLFEQRYYRRIILQACAVSLLKC